MNADAPEVFQRRTDNTVRTSRGERGVIYMSIVMDINTLADSMWLQK
jgi:hypothetical protein